MSAPRLPVLAHMHSCSLSFGACRRLGRRGTVPSYRLYVSLYNVDDNKGDKGIKSILSYFRKYIIIALRARAISLVAETDDNKIVDPT